MATLVIVGRIRRAHGIKGALAVESLTDAPDAIFASGAIVFAGDREGNAVPPDAPQALLVDDGRPMNRDWLVHLREITTRDAADLWRGRYLLADAARLPEPDEDEVYVFSLIGMRVTMRDQNVGTVSDVYEAPQGLLLEVETPVGRSLVPWHPHIVELVDEENRIVHLAPLDGLLDG